jgi:hypothetical protein
MSFFEGVISKEGGEGEEKKKGGGKKAVWQSKFCVKQESTRPLCRHHVLGVLSTPEILPDRCAMNTVVPKPLHHEPAHVSVDSDEAVLVLTGQPWLYRGAIG